MSEKTPFQILREINVNEKTEKKGNLTYLSWAWAVDQLLSADHTANWEYLDPLVFGETMMVRCAVTAFGKRMVSQLPVMDYKNKAISSPNAFEVNTAMQRCLAKGIALHGLGLYIYAGEDMPEAPAVTEMSKKEFVDHCTAMSDAATMEELDKAADNAAAAAKKYGDKEAAQSFKAKYIQVSDILNVANLRGGSK